MIRWSYLVPRLMILGLILLALWMGSDPLIRLALIRSSENTIGAKVDIDQVRTSLSTGKVYLKGIRIADPRNPMLNLVQADMAYVQLNPQNLLKREFVIENGKTSKIRFAAPRTESGALPRIQLSESASEIRIPKEVEQELASISRKWLDEIQNSLEYQIESNFQSVRLAQQLRNRWPEEVAKHKQAINGVQQQISDLKNIVNQADQGNPLRTSRVMAAIQEIESLGQKISDMRLGLSKMQQQAIQDRDKILESKELDRQKIREIVRNAEFDSQTVSQLLLGKSQAEYVNEVVDWFRWFRDAIPNPEQDFYPVRSRGTDIVFPGTTPKPNFLIKALEIDGEGRLAGQHFDFAGTVTNLADQPQLHDQPAGFQLRAQGKQHLIVECTIDRREPIWEDSLSLQCPDLELESQVLGDSRTIAVSMGPSRVQAEVSITVRGEELEGELVFRHTDVLMHVDHMHELAGGKDTALRLNQDLATVGKFQTYIQLSGTLDDPQFSLHSDLGNKFAVAMNHIISEKLQQQVVSYQARLDQILNKELSEYDQTIRTSLNDLSSLLNGEASIISELQLDIPKATDRPKIR